MAYTGATTPNTGTTTAATLSRDVKIDVLESFKRQTKFANLVRSDMVGQGASGGQFIIEGKEDTSDTGLATYPTGTQVNVGNGTQDQRLIPLDRPTYEARRIDKFESYIANYSVLSMNVRQLGSKLANSVDRKVSAGIEAASLDVTNIAGNGVGSVVVNTALNGGLSEAGSAAGKGDALIESIYAAIAELRVADVNGLVYVAMDPKEFQYLPQSLAVNADVTANLNGGIDIGEAKMVGGAIVVQSNNMPATVGLVALAWTEEAVGIAKGWDPMIETEKQLDFGGATLVYAEYDNGVGTLRNQCAVSIKNVI